MIRKPSRERLVLDHLMGSARFEFFNGGEVSMRLTGNRKVTPPVVRPFDIVSQVVVGGHTTIRFVDDGGAMTTQEGDAFYGPSGLVRDSEGEGRNNRRIVRFALFRFRFAGGLALSSLFPEPFVIPADRGGNRLGDIAVRLRELHDQDHDIFAASAETYRLAFEVLSILASHHDFDPASLNLPQLQDSRRNRLLHYLESNFNKPIDVDQLAGIACLSKSRFHQMFKSLFGKTPKGFLTDLRVSKAQELLLMTDQPVSVIADRVGWDDPFYFSRVFRKKTGVSPRDYRVNRLWSDPS